MYKIGREDISDAITKALREIAVERKDVVMEALRLYKSNTLDYADCLLLSGLRLNKQNFISFDKNS